MVWNGYGKEIVKTVYVVWTDGIDIRKQIWEETLDHAYEFAEWYNLHYPKLTVTIETTWHTQ